MFGAIFKNVDRTALMQIACLFVFLALQYSSASPLALVALVCALGVAFGVRSKGLLTLLNFFLALPLWVLALHVQWSALYWLLGGCLLVLSLLKLKSYPMLALSLVMSVVGFLVLGMLLVITGQDADSTYLFRFALGVSVVFALLSLFVDKMWSPMTILPSLERSHVEAPLVSDVWEKIHGITLIVLGLSLPIGEGVAFSAGGLLVLVTLFRSRNLCWTCGRIPAFRPPLIGFAFYILMGLLGYVLGMNIWLEPREIGLLGPLCLVPFVALSALVLPESWSLRALKAFLVSLAVATIFSLVFYALGDTLWATVDNIIGFFSAKMQLRVPGTERDLVVGGFFFHRLKMAHVLIFGIGPVLAFVLFAPKDNKAKSWCALLLLILFTGLIFTYTRAALAGLLMGLLALAFVLRRRFRWVFVCGCALGFVILLSSPQVRHRLESIGKIQALEDRVRIWSYGVDMLDASPLGIGLANYPAEVERRYSADVKNKSLPRTYAHNLLLTAFVETGPLGGIAYVYCWVWILWTGLLFLKAGKRDQENTRRASDLYVVGATALFLFVVFAVIGVLHDVLFHKPVALTFAAAYGMLMAYRYRYRDLVDVAKSPE